MNSHDITIKNKNIPGLYTNLFALDGRPQEGTKAAQPYQFKGAARLALAKNIHVLTPVYEELMEIRKNLRIQYLGQAEPLPDESKHPKSADCEAEWKQTMEAEQVVKLFTVAYEDLRPEHNQIPVSVLSTLWPIIVDEPKG